MFKTLFYVPIVLKLLKPIEVSNSFIRVNQSVFKLNWATLLISHLTDYNQFLHQRRRFIASTLRNSYRNVSVMYTTWLRCLAKSVSIIRWHRWKINIFIIVGYIRANESLEQITGTFWGKVNPYTKYLETAKRFKDS